MTLQANEELRANVERLIQHAIKSYSKLNQSMENGTRVDVEDNLKIAQNAQDMLVDLISLHTEKQVREAQELYNELLYEVETKVPGQTRHETAKMLIRAAQHQDNPPSKPNKGDK